MKGKMRNIRKKICVAGVFMATAGITIPAAIGTVPVDTVFATEGEVEINAANFPDETFRNYVQKQFDSDNNGFLSENEIANVTTINIQGGNEALSQYTPKVYSLQGIQYFTNLTNLDCSNNRLTALDISNNTALTYLDCEGNELNSLDLSKNTELTYLDCSGNYGTLDTLDVSNNTKLTDLRLIYNYKLSSLDVSNNTALTHLDLYSCYGLTELDITNNTALTYLDLFGCSDITELDVTNNTALTFLRVDCLGISNLDISNNKALTELSLGQNEKITDLDVSNNTALTNLFVRECSNITTLDVSKNTSLIKLLCPNNKISSLDLSKNTNLEMLYCFDNGMTYLDLRNTKIKDIHNRILDGNKLTKDNLKVNAGTKIHVNELRLNNKTDYTIKSDLAIGSTMKLTATTFPSFATDGKTVTWSSSNPDVATVDKNGNVKGIKAGSATITARTSLSHYTVLGDEYSVRYEKTAIITVKQVAVTGVKLNKTKAILKKGSSLKLTPTISPSNATDKKVTWSSSNTKVATVDANGNVKAVNHGTANITAKTNNGITATCEVRVNFIDVTDTKSWYYKPVYWAADKGITTGSNGMFTPAGDCTREQAITFLWRMAGKPNPKSMTSKFSDVKDKNRYSYKAVMWGSEKGIITGTNGKFNPTGTCTREQIVTMIWRLAGSPNPKTTTSKFKDVTNKKSYSYKAILWANEKGIATGSNGKFSPTEKCKRRDIVTFIYRYKN